MNSHGTKAILFKIYFDTIVKDIKIKYNNDA